MNKRLVELARLIAALTNAHMHHDLRDMDELERRVAIAQMCDEMEELIG